MNMYPCFWRGGRDGKAEITKKAYGIPVDGKAKLKKCNDISSPEFSRFNLILCTNDSTLP